MPQLRTNLLTDLDSFFPVIIAFGAEAVDMDEWKGC